MASTIRELLAQVTTLWRTQVALCRKDKKEKFGNTADRLWDFYGKRYRNLSFIMDEDSTGDFPHASGVPYRPVLNKSKQFVDLYLPFVHAHLTHRLVRPRRPELPPELASLGFDNPKVKQDELTQSWLMEWWLNYLPTEYDAFTEQRTVLTEALVKGRGVVWHEIVAGPYGDIPGSFHVSVDDLLIDADAKKLRDAGFIIRKRWEPCYQVAADYDIDVDLLRGQSSSSMEEARRAAVNTDMDDSSADSQRKGDLCLIYEVYSRIGIGHRLVGASDEDDLKALGDAMDENGPHVYLVISPDIEYPLNLKPDDVESYGPGPEQQEFVRQQLSWPIPFFEEFSNPWPCSVLDPYPNPDDAWATSPLEAGLPLQEYLDKAYNWIMDRVRKTCRNIILYSAALEKQAEDALESGSDLEMVKVNGKPGDELKKHLEIVGFPDIKGEIWHVISFLSAEYEKATGMTPLMHGMQGESAMRSAQEASIRESHTTSRPQDIAKVVEDWNSKVASKEAQATRLVVDASTVAPLFSEPGPPLMEGTEVPDYQKWVPGPLTLAWMNLVQTDDPARAAAEMHYTVESGSGMRKNNQWMQQAVQIVMPLVMPVAQAEYSMGDPRKWNALMDMVGDGWQIPMSNMMQPEGQPPALPAEPPQSEGGGPNALPPTA